ncbi:MAG: VCBS repeat-containing protein [Anaerolineales bacterium]|nr:VCBS repeat-containing protein [Anaerolineales bacterium]
MGGNVSIFESSDTGEGFSGSVYALSSDGCYSGLAIGDVHEAVGYEIITSFQDCESGESDEIVTAQYTIPTDPRNRSTTLIPRTKSYPLVVHDSGPWQLHLADVDSDSDLDLFLVGSQNLLVMSNEQGEFLDANPLIDVTNLVAHRAGFTENRRAPIVPPDFDLDLPDFHIVDALVVDLDRDSDLDLVFSVCAAESPLHSPVATESTRNMRQPTTPNDCAQAQIVYLANSGLGIFDQDRAHPDLVGNSPPMLASGDIDSDGAAELVVGSGTDAKAILRSMEQCDNAWICTTVTDSPIFSFPAINLALGDIDSDGDQDIIAGELILINQSAGVVYPIAVNPALTADDNPTEARAQAILREFGDETTITSPTAYAVGDVDGDGDDDVIVSTPDAMVTYFSGLFPPRHQERQRTTGSLTTLALGDVDANGTLDLVTSAAGQASMMFRNDGSGVFRRGLRFSTDGQKGQKLTLVDTNGDGSLDIVASLPRRVSDNEILLTDQFHASIGRIYLNDGFGNFDQTRDLMAITPPVYADAGQRANAANSSRSIATADVDGDGDLDPIAGDVAFGMPHVSQPNLDDILVSRVALLDSQGRPLNSTEIVVNDIITGAFSLFRPSGIPVARAEVQYSVNGGGQWHVASISPTLTVLPTGQHLRERAFLSPTISVLPGTEITLTHATVSTPNGSEAQGVARVAVWLATPLDSIEGDLIVTLVTPSERSITFTQSIRAHDAERLLYLCPTQVQEIHELPAGAVQLICVPGQTHAISAAEPLSGTRKLIMSNDSDVAIDVSDWGLVFDTSPAQREFCRDTCIRAVWKIRRCAPPRCCISLYEQCVAICPGRFPR